MNKKLLFLIPVIVLMVSMLIGVKSYAAESVSYSKSDMTTLAGDGRYWVVIKYRRVNTENDMSYMLLFSDSQIVCDSSGETFYALAQSTGSYGYVNLAVTDGVLSQGSGSDYYSINSNWHDFTSHSAVPSASSNDVYVVGSNADIYVSSWTAEKGVYATDTVFFYLSTLRTVAKQTMTTTNILGQTLGILPCLMIFAVGCLAFWKGWSFLSKIWRRA